MDALRRMRCTFTANAKATKKPLYRDCFAAANREWTGRAVFASGRACAALDSANHLSRMDVAISLDIVVEMEDRLCAHCTGEQCMLLMRLERLVVLRDIH